jgi:LmbE family N-acetylglucosaminyl deacetylase
MALIPSVHEKHQDHRHAAHAAETALRCVPRLLAYESPSTTAAFMPTSFADITHHLDDKWRALQCHRSQLAKCMSLEYESMVHLAAFRGQQTGVRFAEAFETLRFVLPMAPARSDPNPRCLSIVSTACPAALTQLTQFRGF